MSRFPIHTREALSNEGQAVWDRIQASRGAVAGPFQVLMPVPPLADRIAELGAYLRFNGILAAPERELAVLAVARELECQYEWSGHEAIARRDGTRPEAIEIVRARGALDGLTERERLVVTVVQTLIRDRRLPDSLFATARDTLGQAHLVELVAVIGFYTMISYVLNGFGLEPDAARPRPF
jgi:4-carboxymuconolactone decarboxylase